MDFECDLAWQACSSSLSKRLSQEPGWFGLTFAVQEPESRLGLGRSVEEKIEALHCFLADFDTADLRLA